MVTAFKHTNDGLLSIFSASSDTSGVTELPLRQLLNNRPMKKERNEKIKKRVVNLNLLHQADVQL